MRLRLRPSPPPSASVRPARTRLALACMLATGLALARAAGAEGDGDAELAALRTTELKVHKEQIVPFIANYCTKCHGEEKKKGGVTFQYAEKNPGATSFRPLWAKAVVNIKSHDMPPDKETKQPSVQERQVFLDWVAGIKNLAAKDPGTFVIRRLNKIEYANTLHDLLGVDAAIARDLPDEVFGAGYTNTFSPLLTEQYLSIANDALTRVLAPAGKPPTPTQQRLFGPGPAAGQDASAAARQAAEKIARTAYRRPPTVGEVDVLMRVYTMMTGAGKAHDEAMRQVLKAILVSPQFLFITPDPETDNSPNIVPLGDHQLAARLSYLLWATMPDAELSALADAGTLHDHVVLAKQAKRMLGDPRARALFDGFGSQWLGLDKLSAKAFDTAKFPLMTPGLRSAMYDEARLLFNDILHENRSIKSFIDCDYTWLNGPLAAIYGLERTVSGPEMRKVQLSDANRGGILSMPGVLATSSFPNRTSPVNRGVWVLEQVLGEHVPPPPPNVPALDKQDPKKVAAMTLRQRTELHRKDAVCASCHKVLDPIGFGLENFDAIGRWRDKDDSSGPIDATGELPGDHRFSTPKELKAIIAARSDDFSKALAGKLLSYALCRQLEGYDEIITDQIAAAVAKDGYRMQTLVTAVVTSYPFTNRRQNDPAGPSHAK